MSSENDRPLREWTVTHIIGFLGLAGAGVGGWVALNRDAAEVRAEVNANVLAGSIYRTENTRRLDRIEDKVDSLLRNEGIRPEAMR